MCVQQASLSEEDFFVDRLVMKNTSIVGDLRAACCYGSWPIYFFLFALRMSLKL